MDTEYMSIGLQGIRVVLRGGGGAPPTGDEFFVSLGIQENQSFRLSPSQSAWQWAIAELFAVNMNNCKNATEPTEEFAIRIREGFERASTLLTKCSVDGLQGWRASGKGADVFIGGWLANEQFDLEIPASFLGQCARLTLSKVFARMTKHG
jgi:hypothetical protein